MAVRRVGLAGLALLALALFSPAASLPRESRSAAPAPARPGQRGACSGGPARPAAALERQGMLRLRGGVPASEEESTESSTQADGAPAEAAAAASKSKDAAADGGTDGVAPPEAEEAGAEAGAAAGAEAGAGAGAEEGGEEGGEEEGEDGEPVLERPKPTPEMVRQMNERMWEAAQEGNEPLLAKALAGGANVNAFCRGPDRWLNISVGEIAGADEAHTGLNAHWMELNNYTALHLAAACGNAGIIDALLEAGADINVECLQRVHPFPTNNGGVLPFLTIPRPLIFKCTALRLARAANCGRCFYTSSLAPLHAHARLRSALPSASAAHALSCVRAGHTCVRRRFCVRTHSQRCARTHAYVASAGQIGEQ